MNLHTRITWRHICVIAVIAIIGMSCLYIFGRSLWHPLMVKIIGGVTVSDRIAEIRERHPAITSLTVNKLTFVAIKDPGYVDVFIDGKKWQRFPFTAQSGTSGPKMQEGDGQIPEGFYKITALNPNSSYHLSMRVSYPNEDDIARSEAAGIHNYGNDIYIHGKNASIGCIALGDHAIEQLFYLVHACGINNVEVLIAPVDLRHSPRTSQKHDALYDQLRVALVSCYQGEPDSLKQ